MMVSVVEGNDGPGHVSEVVRAVDGLQHSPENGVIHVRLVDPPSAAQGNTSA